MPNAKRKTVLLVEDDATIRSFVRLFAVRHGYEVFEAKDGLEGLGLAAHVSPDLVITDLAMPRLDGVELIKELRGSKMVELRTVPIIVISGADNKLLTDAVKAGASLVLSKPVLHRQLIDAIDSMLGK